MRTRLKGINSITKQLADGSWVTYRYAWKGGPPVHGEPGTPEFIDSYNDAVAVKRPTVGKTLLSLTRYFQTTSEFKNDIKPRTRDDYIKQIRIIEKKFGDFPVSGLSDPRARGIFKEWRDELAEKSIRQADYAWTVLARVLSVAKDRGHIKVNPCERGGRLRAVEVVAAAARQTKQWPAATSRFAASLVQYVFQQFEVPFSLSQESPAVETVSKILNMARPTGVDAAQHAVRTVLAEKNSERP